MSVELQKGEMLMKIHESLGSYVTYVLMGSLLSKLVIRDIPIIRKNMCRGINMP